MIQVVIARKEQEIFPGTLPVGESKTALKCRGVSKRFSRLKSRLTSCADLSNCQTLTAFGATTRQNGTAVFGGHTCTETVGAGALDSAGLESTFHGVLPGSSTTGRNGPRFKRPGILEKAGPQVNFQPAFLQ